MPAEQQQQLQQQQQQQHTFELAFVHFQNSCVWLWIKLEGRVVGTTLTNRQSARDMFCQEDCRYYCFCRELGLDGPRKT